MARCFVKKTSIYHSIGLPEVEVELAGESLPVPRTPLDKLHHRCVVRHQVTLFCKHQQHFVIDQGERHIECTNSGGKSSVVAYGQIE